jgi:hypothetical protein
VPPLCPRFAVLLLPSGCCCPRFFMSRVSGVGSLLLLVLT